MTVATKDLLFELSGQKERCIEAFKVALRTRYVDDKMMKLVRQNKGGTFHLSTAGHELVGAVAALNLTPEKDWGLLYYRDRAFAVGLGASITDLFASFLARDIPHHCGSRQMPEHFSHKRLRMPVQSSVVGSQFLQAVGVAKAAQLDGRDDVVYVSAGDGATSQGDFHEALNFAAIHKLSTIFVIQENGWAISVPLEEQMAGGSIYERSKGYHGLDVTECDGTDYLQLNKAFSSATARGRKGEGPSLIIAKVPRIAPHSISDDHKKYKTDEHFEEDQKRDPLPLFEKWLLEMGVFSESEIEGLKSEIKEEVEAASLEAQQMPIPEEEKADSHVYAPSSIDYVEEVKETVGDAPIVIVDALNHALAEEMERDEKVIVFGQDVARGKGGVFGVTATLTEKFGQERCFNTPLAESTISGIAVGLAMSGYRPVAEMQFADYMWTGINQIINEMANIHYRSNGEWTCPAVVRMPCGGYIQGGPYHSQSVEAFLAHCPGLKIVMPSNAADAKRLLKAAIRDPNPVIFLEHKALYRQRLFSAREEPGKEEVLALGHAKVLTEGDDLTVVTYGMLAPMAYEVAHHLEKEGLSIEVIDLRTISPIDMETINASVKKTGKVLIAHEAVKTGGFGAEIAARLSEELFTYLDAPIKRIGALDCMVPYSKDLENAVLPQKEQLEEAMRSLAQF